MSLSLLQGYSSAEEDEHKQGNSGFSDSEDESDTEQNNTASHFPATYKPIIPPKPSHDSSLPSAVDVFSEVFLFSLRNFSIFHLINAFYELGSLPILNLNFIIHFLLLFLVGFRRFQALLGFLIIVLKIKV